MLRLIFLSVEEGVFVTSQSYFYLCVDIASKPAVIACDIVVVSVLIVYLGTFRVKGKLGVRVDLEVRVLLLLLTRTVDLRGGVCAGHGTHRGVIDHVGSSSEDLLVG